MIETDSAKTKSIGKNLPFPDNEGVLPPCWNQLCAINTVIPAAKKFIATPEISWFPLKVIEATPCKIDNNKEDFEKLAPMILN